MIEVGLSLGTNLGKREANMAEAARRISLCPSTRIVATSRLYETKPVGVKAEYEHLPYINGVLILESHLPVAKLSEALHAIEDSMGRVRTEDRFAPRTIDIDILYAGDECSEASDLTLPHPRWMQRRFVVEPLADVRPDLVLPRCKQSVIERLKELNEQKDDVVPISTAWGTETP